MKKLALLLALGLLAACGGGGSESTPSTPVGNVPLTVNIKETQVAKEYTVTSATTRRRVVITNPSLDKPTQAFKKFYDYSTDEAAATISAGLTFTLPETSGYSIEFLEYSVLPGGFKTYSSLSGTAPGTLILDAIFTPTPQVFTSPVTTNILKYDKKTGITVGVTPSITLTATPAPVPTLTIPVTPVTINGITGIPAKSNFEVAANFSSLAIPSMYNSNNWLLQIRKKETANYTNVVIEYQTNVTSPNANIASPVSWFNNEYQLRGGAIFYLNDSILLPGENYSKFNMTTSTPFVPVVVATQSPILNNP